MNDRITYFAYGSNLSPTQMHERCPASNRIGIARLDGWRLAFGGHSQRWGGAVASLRKSPKDSVPGVLYAMPLTDMMKLDSHEGHPVVYRRRRMRVVDENGRGRYAQVYIKDLGEERLPARTYLGVLVDAYLHLGLDVKSLVRALRHSGKGAW